MHKCRVTKEFLTARNFFKEGDILFTSGDRYINRCSITQREVVELEVFSTRDKKLCLGTIPQDFLELIEERDSVDSFSDARVANNVMRHEYRKLTDDEKLQMQKIKDLGLEFFTYVENIGNSKELSIALTKVEEAVMWAVKHITK